MKRIFSIFLCAVIIAALFVVPLSASAEEDDSIVGTWVFNDELTYISSYTQNGQTLSYFDIDFVYDNIQYNQINCYYYDYTVDVYSGGYTNTFTHDYIKLLFNNDDITTPFSPYSNGHQIFDSHSINSTPQYTYYNGWVNDSLKSIVITGGADVNNETFVTWLKANATKQVSYNSLLDYAKAIAEEESDRYPYYAIVRVSDYEYLVIRAAGAMSSPDGEYVTGYAMQANTVKSVDGEYTKNQYWNSMSTDETWTGDLIYANHTIENFPPPLHLRIAKLVGREIPQFSQTVGGNLMTLTLCGVGCLTLLVALVLLYRTLRTYLPR